MGAAKPISFRHIIRNLALRGIFRRWGCSASILNAKRLLRNRTESTRSTSGTGIMSNANAADANCALDSEALEYQLQLGDGVSTGSGSDRVAIPPITILAIRCDPVATAPSTDDLTHCKSRYSDPTSNDGADNSALRATNDCRLFFHLFSSARDSPACNRCL